MGLIVVIGDVATISGFALAGATVRSAEDPDDALRAWNDLPEETSVVLLTPEAAAAIGERPAPRDDVLRVVLPS